MTKEEIEKVLSRTIDFCNGDINKAFDLLVCRTKALKDKKPIECTYQEVIDFLVLLKHGIFI